MVFANDPENFSQGSIFRYFAGGQVNCVLIQLHCQFFGGDRLGGLYDPARISPPTTKRGESFGDALLMELVQVLAQISATAHIPGDKIRSVTMNAKVFILTITGDLVPNTGQGVVVLDIERNRGIEVEMRTTPGLEFCDPDITNVRENLTYTS